MFYNIIILQHFSKFFQKNFEKKSLIYLDCILKGRTFAPAFQEKKALQN